MILRDDNRSIEQTWNMKKWYSFYTSYEDFGNAVNALSSQMDISSLKLQQVAAEIQETASEEKLQQVVAERTQTFGCRLKTACFVRFRLLQTKAKKVCCQTRLM